MNEVQSSEVSEVLEAGATYLEQHAEDLVASWIEWVQARVPTETVAALPDGALRNHVPPVLECLAQYLRSPVEMVRVELLSHLRLHGQVRRDQGYSLEEVLAEFDGLADIVTRRVHAEVEDRLGQASCAELLELSRRLAGGLRSISYIAMGSFDQSERERSHSMSIGLEEFARAVGHELRGPLNTLSIGLQVLRQQLEPSPETANHLGVLEAAVKRSASLLDTIQVLAMVEQARAGDRLVSLAAAVRRVFEELGDRAEAADVELRVEGELPEVNIEAVMAYFVLVNLISNSIKYSDPDKRGREVAIAARFIDEEHDTGFCELEVRDNGVGIPAELLPRVCQKGFRAHPDRTEGTGLGLFIAQRAIHERGGELNVESVEGEGTTVTIRLRGLEEGAHTLTAERFKVEHLMGESIWSDIADEARDG